MNLKYIRTNRRFSQEELAKLSGLNVRTIQRIENGGKPSVESLKCIASALEIDISTIYSEKAMSNTQPNDPAVTTRAQANSVIYLLSAATILIVIGSGAANTEGFGGLHYVGAWFYVIAAACFLTSAYKMFKYRLGM
ncbi:helix-turn-helix transcriptional regulator [Paraglaciecola sp.]|uniref:helix-turn-helix domain-containing protein n=1 Tax=Paraglaciecola sp. TaxID=1920173 RepID=UPI0030F45082